MSPWTPSPDVIGTAQAVSHCGHPEEGAAVLPQGWADLVALTDDRPVVDPMARLKRLCALAAESTGASGTAISVSTGDVRSTVCATDTLADELEELQDTLGEGPAVEALGRDRAVLVPDLVLASDTWPAFVPAASARGVSSIFAFPLGMGAMRLGTLALYRNGPGALRAGELADARTLVDAAAVLLTMEPSSEQTGPAFAWVLGDDSRFRPEVHQAVGATTVHLGVSPREAFARLCGHAYATGTPMAVVAREVLTRQLRLPRD